MLARVNVSLLDAQRWLGKNGPVKGNHPSFWGLEPFLPVCILSPIWLTPPPNLGTAALGLGRPWMPVVHVDTLAL